MRLNESIVDLGAAAGRLGLPRRPRQLPALHVRAHPLGGRTATQRLGLGARCRMLIRVGSAEVGGLIEIVECDEPQRPGLDARSPASTSAGRWRLREAGGGSHPGRAALRLRRRRRRASPAASPSASRRPTIRRHLRRSLQQLKREVEHERAERRVPRAERFLPAIARWSCCLLIDERPSTPSPSWPRWRAGRAWPALLRGLVPERRPPRPAPTTCPFVELRDGCVTVSRSGPLLVHGARARSPRRSACGAVPGASRPLSDVLGD